MSRRRTITAALAGVQPSTALLTAVLARGGQGQRKRSFKLLTLLLSLSGVLLVKPPPYDVLLAIVIVTALLSGTLRVQRSSVGSIVPLTFYVATTIASSCTAVTAWDAVWYDGMTLFCGLLWWYFMNMFHRHGSRCLAAVMTGYVITSLIGVAFGIFIVTADIPHKGEFLFYDRPTGMFLDANVFGASLVPPLIYGLSQLFDATHRKRRWAWATSSVVLVIGIVTTMSRGATVNAVLSLTVFVALIAVKVPQARRMLLATAIVVTGVGVAYVRVGDTIGLSDAITQRFRLQPYDHERWQAHAAALNVALTHPLLGVGPGQFGTAGSPREVLYRNHYRPLATHNTYLHVAAESGIFALLALVLFFISTLLRARKALTSASTTSDFLTAAWALSCLLGVFVNAWVIDSYHWRHLWLMCAMPWANGASGIRRPLTAAYIHWVRQRPAPPNEWVRSPRSATSA